MKSPFIPPSSSLLGLGAGIALVTMTFFQSDQRASRALSQRSREGGGLQTEERDYTDFYSTVVCLILNCSGIGTYSSQLAVSLWLLSSRCRFSFSLFIHAVVFSRKSGPFCGRQREDEGYRRRIWNREKRLNLYHKLNC